jgi:hypothetical protein
VAELTLEPYAVVQHWHLPSADGHWETILTEYLQTLAQRGAASGKTVVGHIKALALFSGGRYLRVSVVAPHLPASREGQVPAGCAELDLTLNVLIYGLDRAALERITHTAAQELADHWKGVITHSEPHPADHPSHHSHSPEQKEHNDE